MSGRTVSPLTLTAALLFAALAPAGAQEGTFQAPLNSGGPPTMAPPVPPLPRLPTMSPPAPPATTGTGAGARVVVPALGPVGLSTDFAMPVVKGPFDHRQVFNFSVGLFGSQQAPPCCQGTTGGIGSYCAPALPRLHQPSPFVAGPGSIRLAAAEDVLMAQPPCPPCPLPKIAPNALLGTWYRALPGTGMVVAATFTHDELKLHLTQYADGHTVTVTVTAHYAIAADGLVYGAMTGADVDTKSAPKAGGSLFGAELAELSIMCQALVDVPFSFRTKLTSSGLMVSNVKCGIQADRDEAEKLQAVFGGLFKSAKDGKVPAPAVPATATSKAAPPSGAPGALIGSSADRLPPPIPAAQPIERVGIDFSPNPPVVDAPCPPKPVAPPASRAPVSADSTKQLAEDAFGQLLQQSGVTRPASGMTLPSGKYLEHYPQYFPPDPVLPLPRELASQDAPGCVRPTSATVAAGPAKGSPIGTWYRDVAGKQCVVKVTPDHLTLTVHDAQEIDGKVSTASLVITADYHTARDGITAVGLITSVDVNFEGEFPPEDSKPFFEMLSELQKVLEDKPFALTFRMYGEALVIGNVRMPQVSDRMDVQPAGYLAGRYKPAGDKLPKPKPTKMPTEFKVPGGSSPGAPGRVLPPDTGVGSALPLVPPAGASPEPNCILLPPQRIPTPPQRVIPSGALESYPQMGEPMKPVPQMPQPTPPPGYSLNEGSKPERSASSPARRTFLGIQTYSSDPNIRMEQLLYQSEDLPHLQNEWRRFWFNDQPSYLTPERIHGGIY